MTSLDRLLNHLKIQGVLNNPSIENAFSVVDRADFVLPDQAGSAYEDNPLPIGFSQTISQPYTVAIMLDLLDLQPGQSVLDIGSGSGWTTALLAKLTGSEGRVLGLERHPELVDFGSRNLKGYSFPWAHIRCASMALGDPYRTYDRILVSASATHFPVELVEQMNPLGILVLPIGHSIWKITRCDEGLVKEELYGFSFVPLISD
ncbi:MULTISPECIES: protein-L-isoaspartate O-methyltransferase [unclassified Oceanispirochaeta]|uniref:protein-L-isoaspartate O-methyltransferase family protein n=1 Tax=unclassified Oceanispirochaeta TaxID=2635722 RepID=UPI000E090D73|nr:MULTISPECIES: methyltransferase domain-containing protein [unclassified Oceanispirochaeta]MBF9016305.1 methyltransferase domain-containing protein [Oceanispirochaeta sp. M2]NPD72768.1 methyltransferase domain-containing protein [Oceanispirochaeta sp. M1]RDG31613.1 methyltransferase domain-containing protein [Oceanispirochaeta sp. M1]